MSDGELRLVTIGGKSIRFEVEVAQTGTGAAPDVDAADAIDDEGGVAGTSVASIAPALAAIKLTSDHSTRAFLSENPAGVAMTSLAGSVFAGIWTPDLQSTQKGLRKS
jgi:hypothetical protein